MLAMEPLAAEEADYAEAEAALAALAEQYPDYAAANVAEMKARLADIDAHMAGLAAASAALFAVAHNVKGQGASFGYDLMTHLGEALCERLRDRQDLSEADARFVRAAVAACDTVIAERLSGDGGARGQGLLAAAGVAHPAAS